MYLVPFFEECKEFYTCDTVKYIPTANDQMRKYRLECCLHSAISDKALDHIIEDLETKLSECTLALEKDAKQFEPAK